MFRDHDSNPRQDLGEFFHQKLLDSINTVRKVSIFPAVDKGGETIPIAIK